MELHEYAHYDATGLRNLMRAGELSAAEVEAVARHALDVANAELNGLASPLFSPALDHAADGPFAGVPFLIKDSGPMAQGVPFFIGSRSVRHVVAPHDSELMTRFRAAGLVTLGLTTVPEMAISFSTESVKHGPTRNPWDLQRGVGGSSGGAAALVAAGAVPLAHGNDGAGSIRIPASCCGLVGLKPSRGRTPCGPDTGEALFGLASEFGLARTVRDAAHLLDAIHGPGVGDKYTAPPPRGRYADELGLEPGPLKVAVTTQAWSGVAVDPEVAAAAARAGRMLEDMGHVVTDASPAVDWEAVMHSTAGEMAAIAAPFLMAPRPPDPDKMEAVSRQVLKEATGTQRAGSDSRVQQPEPGDPIGGRVLHRIRPAGHPDARRNCRRRTARCNTTTPTTAREAGTSRSSTTGRSPSVFNISGQPAISLPLAQSESGLPIGVQFVAPYGREDLLFQLASQLEQAMPWKHRTPNPYVGRR